MPPCLGKAVSAKTRVKASTETLRVSTQSAPKVYLSKIGLTSHLSAHSRKEKERVGNAVLTHTGQAKAVSK